MVFATRCEPSARHDLYSAQFYSRLCTLVVSQSCNRIVVPRYICGPLVAFFAFKDVSAFDAIGVPCSDFET